jgi:PiT family inorganic phosphate transporter
MVSLLFISSGLFLGWSLGANDAANLFGTAVSTKMVKFSTAAVIISIFVIIGAVFGGAGTTETLGALGDVNTLPGAFIVALAAGLTVYLMTNYKLPVSTTQSIVGAIIGWNLFSGYDTEFTVLTKIVGTWIFSPILSAIFAILFFKIADYIVNNVKIHLFKIDMYTRIGLILVGAFGAYSLGANNIANVMGVFTKTSIIGGLDLNIISLSNTQVLFLLGGISISIGVFTYSKRVMTTVGKSIFRISPVASLIVVLSSSAVLFVFASEGLQSILITLGLPTLPLVPVSGSQAVVGAVIGIGLAKGGRNINYKLLSKIGLGWIVTPLLALLISYIALFFMQNVFMHQVYL